MPAPVPLPLAYADDLVLTASPAAAAAGAAISWTTNRSPVGGCRELGNQASVAADADVGRRMRIYVNQTHLLTRPHLAWTKSLSGGSPTAAGLATKGLMGPVPRWR